MGHKFPCIMGLNLNQFTYINIDPQQRRRCQELSISGFFHDSSLSLVMDLPALP
jgi:hypothetical protein